MLKFRIEGQKLTWENPDEVVVAGTKKYLECYFEFDGDAWSGFEYIEAFFKNGRDKPIRMLLSANRIWKEDELCLTAGDWSVYLCATTYNTEKEEIERQITSSSVSIRVLAHGQFEDAQNSFESPEIANQYIAAMQVYEEAREKAEDERVEAENARNVFEEYNPDKTYVKGNKVAYEGSSYVLMAESAMGTNPTDGGAWLLIAKKGKDGKDGADGKDAVLPDGNMSLCGDVAILPVNAKVGDVYRVTTTIYDNGVYYIPIRFTNAVDADKNTLRYSFESDSGYEEYVVYALEDMLEKGVSYFKLSDDEKEYNVPLSGAGVIDHNDDNYEYYFDSTLVSEEMYNRGAMFIHLPEEIGDEYFAERKAIKFKKGDFAVFTETGWESCSSPEATNVKQTIRDERAITDEKFNNLSGNYAYNSLSNVSNEDFKAKAEEAGVGGDAGFAEEKSGLKRIGFTDDCNYVAVDGNASAAFITAVREANDGDTIIVMPGTYNGGSQLDIAKNLTFVGIGRPTLDFAIRVEYADPVVYNTNWYNFDFNGEISVSFNQEYNEPFVHSSFNVFGCTVQKPNYMFVGNSRHSTIVFNKQFGSMGGNFGDPGNSYEYCDIYLEEACGGELVATNCNIYIDFDNAEMDGYFTFKNCNIYNPKNKKLGQLWSSYGNKSAKDCNVFGYSCFQEDEIIEGCKLFGCTEL